MRTFFPKKTIAILIGIIFLMGGAGVAMADETVWIFKYQQDQTGPSISIQRATEAECTAAEAEWAKTPGKTIVQQCQPVTTSEAAVANSASLSDPIPLAPASVDPNLANLVCGIVKGELVNCIPVTVYYLIYKPFSWLLVGAGYIFDFTLALSIDKKFVDQVFVVDSWKIIRDFSNMAFIFILLYTGISTMLGMGNWKKTVLQVVIIALLINFSLFFTKVVIDAGNILAVGIYSSMGTPKSASETHLNSPSAGFEERNISAGLVKAFEPQSFISAAGAGGLKNPMDATVIFIISALVNGFAAWVFFKAALLFIGRLIAFWFLMIVSPFAFISTTFPKGNKFEEWFHLLIAQAFVAPVFLFMVYLIMQLVSGGSGILGSFVTNQGGAGGNFTFNTIIGPVIVATILIIALQKSLKFAEKMAGDFGALGAKLGGKVLGVAGMAAGLAGGVALGGAAFAGRQTFGRAAQRIGESEGLKKFAGNNPFLGKMAFGATDKLSKGTFDLRGVKAVQSAAKKGGVSVGNPWAGAKGGFEGGEKRQHQADLKFAEKLEVGEGGKESLRTAEEEEVRAKKREEEAKTQTEEAQKNTKAVEEAHEKSSTGQAVKDAESSLRASEKMNEVAKAKVAGAQKAFDDARNTGKLDDALKVARDTAKKEEAGAMRQIEQFKTTVATAKGNHEKSSTAQAVKDATIILDRAKEVESAATQAVREAKEEITRETKAIADETKDRKEAYAQHVETRGRTILGSTGRYSTSTYSHKQAQVTARAIRGGKEKAKEESDVEKLVKRLAKLEEKGEHKEKDEKDKDE